MATNGKTQQPQQAATAQRSPNFEIFDQVRSVPDNMTRQFTIGRGDKQRTLTDINPMWRIEKLTEIFGPSGQGWYISDVHFWSDLIDGKVNAFCTLNLNVKNPKTGEWMKPIFGIGGNSMTKQGDEAYKCAYTDAISIACKSLGFAADIYFGQERTKYDQEGTLQWGQIVPYPQMPQMQAAQSMQPLQPIQPVSAQQGSAYNPMQAQQPQKHSPLPLPVLQMNSTSYRSAVSQVMALRGKTSQEIYNVLTQQYSIDMPTWQNLCLITNINPQVQFRN